MAAVDGKINGGLTLGRIASSARAPWQGIAKTGFIIVVGPGSGTNRYYSPIGVFMSKSQFVSTEPLKIVFPPFTDRATGLTILGTDIVTLTIKRPNGTLLPSPPVPTWDTDVRMWIATISIGSFQEGDWLIRASSNGGGAQDQLRVLTWGDYVDDIQETRQAALGRWRIDQALNKLFLYEEDGVTVFREFDLKDATGTPSTTQIFERDPV